MKKKIIIVCSVVAVLLVGVAAFFLIGRTESTNCEAYENAVTLGYSGTEEEWLAALVGETVPDEQENAYQLACQKGYRGSFEEWMCSLTGTAPQDTTVSAYQWVQQNGFEGTLSDWLNSLFEHPEKLGHSGSGGKTQYELACEYGFEGNFIEWLVSLISIEN